jgi:hypothetical protein
LALSFLLVAFPLPALARPADQDRVLGDIEAERIKPHWTNSDQRRKTGAIIIPRWRPNPSGGSELLARALAILP